MPLTIKAFKSQMKIRSLCKPWQLLLFCGLLCLITRATSAKTSLFRAPKQSVFNVLEMGARGDGKTDDTPAFQRAIDRANAIGGGVVFVPRGNFLIKTHLVVKENVTLKGIFEAPPARTQDLGSTLLAVENAGGLNGTPFITLKANGTLKGLSIFYPNQREQMPPLVYPWTVRGDGDNCSIVDTLMVNPYAAVDFGTVSAGRHYINGLYAQALYRGVFVDKCYDVGRIQNVHFWQFWRITPEIDAWTRQNAIAFILGRTDWEYLSNCFCIQYKTGYQFVALKDGPGNAVLTNCGSDQGPLSVDVQAVQDHAGVSFTNGQFMAGIHIGPNNRGPVKFTSCGFWGEGGITQNHAVLEGKNQTIFSSCHFIGWDQRQTGAPCLQVEGGGLSVQGCDFMDLGKAQIHLGPNVESAIILGNRLRGGQKIDTQSQGDVQMGLNSQK